MINPVLAALGRPFRLGIVGGAPPSMIGPVHRVASIMDQRFVLVAGVLSSRPERSRVEGLAAGLFESRCYGSVEDLIAKERARDDGIEVLAIITPNDSHAHCLRLAMSAALDVMVEKLYRTMKDFDPSRAKDTVALIVDRDARAEWKFRALLDDLWIRRPSNVAA